MNVYEPGLRYRGAWQDEGIMARDPVLPTLRAALFAALCLALGAGAHEAMSAGAIPAWALLIGGFGAFVPARYAAGRGEHGLLGISALMGVVQVGLHLLFCFAQQAGSARGVGAMPTMPGMPEGMPMPPMPGMGAPASAAAGCKGGGMLLGHALAALACAWWLRRGEAALHAVIRSAVVRLSVTWAVAVLVLPPADRVPRPPRTRSRTRALRSLWQRGIVARRGPPPVPVHL